MYTHRFKWICLYISVHKYLGWENPEGKSSARPQGRVHIHIHIYLRGFVCVFIYIWVVKIQKEKSALASNSCMYTYKHIFGWSCAYVFSYTYIGWENPERKSSARLEVAGGIGEIRGENAQETVERRGQDENEVEATQKRGLRIRKRGLYIHKRASQMRERALETIRGRESKMKMKWWRLYCAKISTRAQRIRKRALHMRKRPLLCVCKRALDSG